MKKQIKPYTSTVTEEELNKVYEEVKKENRNDHEFQELLENKAVYDRIVDTILKAEQYKTAERLLEYGFIDFYDIAVRTGIPAEEVRCIQYYMENKR